MRLPLVLLSAPLDDRRYQACLTQGSESREERRCELRVEYPATVMFEAGQNLGKEGALVLRADLNEVTSAVVQQDDDTLTPQQVRVLMMLGEGLLNKQIAYELSVSEATVKAHVSAILQKLGVESRTQAVIAASKIEAGQWKGGVAGG